MNEFILLSDLRKQAYKNHVSHKKPENQSKLINQIIGINTVNKQWLETARTAFEKAGKNTAFMRVSLLQESLIAIYTCEYAMKNSGIHDQTINQLRDRVENSYFNTCLEFIESCIHNEKTMMQYYNTLTGAVALLEEYNSRLAQQYKVMLNRKQSLVQSMQKIQESLELNPVDLNENHLYKIKTLLKHHENDFKVSPSLREEVLEDLRIKMDELMLYYQEKISGEEKNQFPSLLKIIKHFEDFEKTYKPFADILEQRRYIEFLDKKENFQQYQDFFSNHYQTLAELYRYHNLPRRQIDKIKLINALRETQKYLHYKDIAYIEFKELNPSLQEMIQRFDSILAEEFRDDLVNYYKIHNDLINADENEEKIPELIRFIKHLNIKLNNEQNHYLHDKLIQLRNESLQNLDNSIQDYLKRQLSTCKKADHLKQFFDFILNHLFELGDINRIESMQAQKKLLIKAYNEMEQWISELKKENEMFHQLPESNLKYNLKEAIMERIRKISEVLPLVNQYQMSNVSEISHLLYKIESKLNENSSTEVNECPKLIILDQYTMKNFVVFCKEVVSIGREDDNDIVISCNWISANHCRLDFRNGVLYDNDSTNGTYVNSAEKNIKEAVFGNFRYFNLAEAFEFELKPLSALSGAGFSYQMKLNRITDLEIFRDNQLRELIQSLFNTEFVFLKNNEKLCLNKLSGQINDMNDPEPEHQIILEVSNNGFLLSDPTHHIVKVNLNDQNMNELERFKILMT
ncbi:MAG TPA: FHA domain-containing protein [Candidatus Cloacimonadota bacterium]|nr:FHA domain-containing protein [Candidatus Cloacimonadota bacterium]